jgi:hypothetical protein
MTDQPNPIDAALQNYIRAANDRKPGYRQRIEAAWLELLAAMDAQQRSEENMHADTAGLRRTAPTRGRLVTRTDDKLARSQSSKPSPGTSLSPAQTTPPTSPS